MEYIIDNVCLMCSSKIQCHEYFGRYVCLPDNVHKVCLYEKYDNDHHNYHIIKFVCHNCINFVKKLTMVKKCHVYKCKNTILCDSENHVLYFCDQHVNKCKYDHCFSIILGGDKHCKRHLIYKHKL